MADFIIMPKQGQSVESCIITKWNKQVGDDVKVGDVLFSYETDKATFEEEAATAGILLAILAKEGEDVPCLNNVAIIGGQGEDISVMNGAAKTQDVRQAGDEKVQAAVVEPSGPIIETTQRTNEDSRVFVSPRAKKTAERQGMDAAMATPSGPNGRIIERDIYRLSEETAQSPAAPQQAVPTADVSAEPGDYTDEKLSNVRKVIAKAMHASLSNMAQLTNHTSFDTTKLLEYRKQIKARKTETGVEDITLNDMILFAVSRVLKNYPSLNAHYLDDKMRLFHTVNLGIAVDTDRGLLVPTLFGADKKSLGEISRDAKALIKAAQSGRIAPGLLADGTFTVTNLGSLGVEVFTPVINPPQTAILGVCSIVPRVRETDGELKQYPAMGLSLTYDHRAVDGAPAARFAKELCNALENFDLLLAI
ncbi:MAG: dihydrolipoamide acetyltransferase family protein [Eubacteriales bacterium]|nr:dihydrolipoamide acetyltransferase family protein [Eubacteriales bacterium]